MNTQEEERLAPGDWPGAVAEAEGPQLVVAGPGTGKTEFLVRRAVHLLADKGLTPGALLILTFSRRSASRIRRRILEGLGGGATSLAASTFHSFASRLIESHGDRPPAPILTGPEQVSLVGHLLAAERPTDWPLPLRGLLHSPTFAAEVADFVLRCRERLIDAARLADRAAGRADWRALPAFLERYETELRQRERLDYGTLVADAIDLIQRPDIRARVHEQIRYVLVDEYQDTSPAQARLLELVAGSGNITVAADPYQSIYSFRGADLRNVAEFTDRFRQADGGPARRIILTHSFRVPEPILAAALRITGAGDLPGGAGPVDPAPHPGRVEAYVFDQEAAEAEWIASEIERVHLEERIPFTRLAVLVRSKRHLLPELSRALQRRNIPHNQPDRRLVDHPAVRIVLDLTKAALGVAAEPAYPTVSEDLDRTMRRILLGRLFGLSISHERELLRERRRTGAAWPDLLRTAAPEAEAVADLISMDGWARAMSAADGFWHAWQSIPQFGSLVMDETAADDRAALASLSQVLARQAERDPSVSLADFLSRADDEDFEAQPLLATAPAAGLVLTTLHQAKGLEFDHVFIADASEGAFPDLRRSRSLLQPRHLEANPAPATADEIRFRLQEEMRLAYTAMTRARFRVVWTATSATVDESERRPSRFLVAAAGASDTDDLGPPARRDGPAVTRFELEADLRRLAADPSAPAARRLAAIRILAESTDPRTFAGVGAPGPTSGVISPPIRLSPSQAESYETCPRRYVFERRLHVGDVASPYARFGSVIHRVLEVAEGRAMEDGRGHATFDEALDDLNQLVDGEDFGTPTLAAAWKRRGAELLRRLYDEWPPESLAPVALEAELRWELDGVKWIGRADRVERDHQGNLRIVDYKSGSTAPTGEEAAQSLQMGFYLLAARGDAELARHGHATAAELWYPLSTRKNWRLPFDIDRLPTVTDRMTAATAGILAEDWTPRVGTHCGRCPIRSSCDRWPEGAEAFVG